MYAIRRRRPAFQASGESACGSPVGGLPPLREVPAFADRRPLTSQLRSSLSLAHDERLSTPSLPAGFRLQAAVAEQLAAGASSQQRPLSPMRPLSPRRALSPRRSVSPRRQRRTQAPQDPTLKTPRLGGELFRTGIYRVKSLGDLGDNAGTPISSLTSSRSNTVASTWTASGNLRRISGKNDEFV